MPETKNRTKGTSAPKTGKAPARSDTVTVTAASKAPARSSASQGKKASHTAASQSPAPKKSVPKKNAPKKDATQKDKPDKNTAGKGDVKKERSRFSEHFLPYIFGGIALFLTVCFILDAVGGAATPDDHLMGFVGYYLCNGLFGCMGWAAYLLPLVLVNLTIFWRKYCEERLVAVKVILSALLIILVSAIIHVGVCTGDPSRAKVFNVAYLYTTGAAFEGGGIVGGVVGNLMYTGLKLPGSIVLSVVIIPLILMLLVGVTPTALFGKIRSAAKASKEKKAARRAERDDDDDDDDERDERVDRNRRKGAEAESRRDAKGKVKADEEEPEEAEETDEGEESSAKSARAEKSLRGRTAVPSSWIWIRVRCWRRTRNVRLCPSASRKPSPPKRRKRRRLPPRIAPIPARWVGKRRLVLATASWTGRMRSTRSWPC